MRKIGILLSGCGFYDGTEVAEAVLAALSLERAGARPAHLAPAEPQLHAVDHLTGSEVEGEVRGVLVESARLARGRIRALGERVPRELAGLIVPGGQGAVKNLTTGLARPGERRRVHPQVGDLLEEMIGAGLPVGAIGLGRVVVQSHLGDPLEEEDLTMPATGFVADGSRRLFFTPGFLSGGSLPEVAEGVDGMVRAMLEVAC